MSSEVVGAIIPRDRLWWVAARSLSGPPEDITAFFLTLLHALKLSPGCLHLSDVFTVDDKIRREEALRCGVPSLLDLGSREPLRKKKEYDYKMEHLEAFRRQGLNWPVQQDDWIRFARVINFNGMLVRERELAIFCHTLWPIQPGYSGPGLKHVSEEYQDASARP